MESVETVEGTETETVREKITVEIARDLLLRATATQGRRFVYNPKGFAECTYSPMPKSSDDDNDPRTKTGCLVGTALTIYGETRHLIFAGSVDSLWKAYPYMMTRDAKHYFQQAQIAQDSGRTWGESFDASESWWRTHWSGSHEFYKDDCDEYVDAYTDE